MWPSVKGHFRWWLGTSYFGALWTSTIGADTAFWKSPERTPPGGPNPNFTRQVEMSPNDVRVSDSTGSVYTYRFLCLPDTVDPRGPKAP